MVERLRGRAGQKQRARRLMRTDGLCERCDERAIVRLAVVVDHIKPLALGGSDEDSNTRNLCKPCHDEVTAEQFGHARHGQGHRAQWSTDQRRPPVESKPIAPSSRMMGRATPRSKV